MRCSKDHTIKTTAVASGTTAKGDLSAGGVLRFERQPGAMTGQAVMSAEDGRLTLHYVDGSAVQITT